MMILVLAGSYSQFRHFAQHVLDQSSIIRVTQNMVLTTKHAYRYIDSERDLYGMNLTGTLKYKEYGTPINRDDYYQITRRLKQMLVEEIT